MSRWQGEPSRVAQLQVAQLQEVQLQAAYPTPWSRSPVLSQAARREVRAWQACVAYSRRQDQSGACWQASRWKEW
jgi:hypothetical protein